MGKRVFDKEYLLNKGLPYDGYIINRLIDKTRQYLIKEVIFSDDEKYWRAEYLVSLLESPWEFVTKVVAIEVEPRIVTKTEWVESDDL